MRSLQNAEFCGVFVRGLGGLDNLEADEQVAFISFLNGVLRMFESFYLQKQDGTFNAEIYDPWGAQLVDLFGNTGAQEYWMIRRHNFVPMFADHVDQLRNNTESHPMYHTKGET